MRNSGSGFEFKEFEKAIAVLEELIKSGQDKTATGFAHLALARIYKQKGAADIAATANATAATLACIPTVAFMLFLRLRPAWPAHREKPTSFPRPACSGMPT